MTLEDLYIKLKEAGIPEDRYYLHGIYGSSDDNDKYALVIKRGKYTIIYEVYYRERGEKSSVKTFTDEDRAYQYIYRRITGDDEFKSK